MKLMCGHWDVFCKYSSIAFLSFIFIFGINVDIENYCK